MQVCLLIHSVMFYTAGVGCTSPLCVHDRMQGLIAQRWPYTQSKVLHKLKPSNHAVYAYPTSARIHVQRCVYHVRASTGQRLGVSGDTAPALLPKPAQRSYTARAPGGATLGPGMEQAVAPAGALGVRILTFLTWGRWGRGTPPASGRARCRRRRAPPPIHGRLTRLGSGLHVVFGGKERAGVRGGK
jgi:hypothetical protein